jgi:hypothetical protein
VTKTLAIQIAGGVRVTANVNGAMELVIARVIIVAMRMNVTNVTARENASASVQGPQERVANCAISSSHLTLDGIRIIRRSHGTKRDGDPRRRLLPGHVSLGDRSWL